MSFCTVPTVAAKSAVSPPTNVTTDSAVSLVSNKGERRQTMNTPAVTIVAAWIKAETGVGPSIASGSQVWRPSCADLPQAPMKSRMQIKVSVSIRIPRKPIVDPAMFGAAWRISGIEIVPKTRKQAKMPRLKPKSPTRLTMNAFIAAAFALGLWYQKPISK